MGVYPHLLLLFIWNCQRNCHETVVIGLQPLLEDGNRIAFKKFVLYQDNESRERQHF